MALRVSEPAAVVGQGPLGGGPSTPHPVWARPGAVFALIVFATTLVPMLVNPVAGLLNGRDEWPLPIPAGATFALLIGGCAIQTGSLILSRSRPALATALALLAYVGLLFILDAPQWLTSMQLVIALSLFLLGSRTTPGRTLTWTVVITIAGVGALAVWPATIGAEPGLTIGFILANGLSLAAPVAGGAALGAWWGLQTRRVARVREEAEELRRLHDDRVTRARAVERSRIAQELHDVAGQHLAGLITLADAAIALAADRPDEALTLLEDVRSEGRFAAASLAGALGELRAADTTPAETTRDLRHAPELVRYWQRRGMDVRLISDGELDDLPAVVSTTAYRAIQEALTNAAKHAPGAVVAIRVTSESGMLDVVIDNGPRRAGASDAAAMGLGWGINALRERVQALRGAFWAGETPDGGWSVRVRVPVTPAESVQS